MEQNFNCQNMPGFNYNTLHSAFVVNTYVLSIQISPSDGNVKHGGPFVVFDKNRLMLVPGFSSNLLHSRHSYIIPLTHVLILDIFSWIYIHNILQWDRSLYAVKRAQKWLALAHTYTQTRARYISSYHPIHRSKYLPYSGDDGLSP